MFKFAIEILNSSSVRFCNVAYAFDFRFTGILPLPRPRLLHTGDTVGLFPGLFQGRIRDPSIFNRVNFLS